MDELEPLAAALRRELGSPPEAWQQAQRARLRESMREPPRRSPAKRLALWVLAPAVLVTVALFMVLPRQPAVAERWLVGEELRGPVRLADGSSISLEPGGRGRLFESASAVRFDLHRGRAGFDVISARLRPWTVSAGKNEIRVIGTRFRVAYGPEETFEVEVERGTVSVRVPERNASLELKAGDRLHGRSGSMEVAHALAPQPRPPERRGADAAVSPASAEPAPAAAPVASAAPNDWQAHYRAGRYGESLALVRTAGVAGRLNRLPASELANLADVARLGGDPELAARALMTLLRRFPGSVEARDGKFLLGRVHVLRGDDTAAIDAFESYLQSGNSTLYRNEALGRLMELYSGRGDQERARAAARRYLEQAPNGPYRRLAQSLAAQR